LGFGITIGTIIWKIGKMQSATEIRLVKIENSVEHLKENGLSIIRQDLIALKEEFRAFQTTRDEMIKNLERESHEK
jgi:hypothetical protein